MKKLLLILLFLPLLFSSCEEDTPTPNANNNGNNSDTFLSINDGTVWICQEDGSNINTFVGGDSLIGFYNATNFVYHIQRENWDTECMYLFEYDIEEDGVYSNCEIITNTSNEFVIVMEEGYIGSAPISRIKRRITTMGGNQLLNEAFSIDSFGNETPIYINDMRTYIKSTTLQNLSCN